MFNTSRLQYEDNRNDEHDGFQIISKHSIKNLTENEKKAREMSEQEK